MFDTSIYTVGWVCAIHPELVAAQLHLDLKHDKKEYEAPVDDTNSYVFGSIGKHNIVIAALPTGEYGISSAATVASHMIRTFPNVKVGLMVGIAGGAPLMEEHEEKKQDIRLGDVVVSIPGGGQGGVHQYDYGKAVQGHEFMTTGHLNSPPASLLTVVTSLRADMDIDIDEHDIDKSIKEVLNTYPRLQKRFCRPDASTDQLHASDFVHPDENKSCSSTCTGSENMIQRPSREDKPEGNVVIHYGLIASANRLMKDANVRNALARHANVLCFEMEAAGLMNQLPFLGYAAMTAAAYAKRLLLALSPSKVEALTALGEVREVVQKTFEEIGQIREVIKDQQRDDMQLKICQWLAAPDPTRNHKKALGVRHQGSGRWLIEDDIFCRNLHTRPLLWLHGISGSGKTVLAATVVEHLQRSSNEEHMTLYFYFDFQDTHKQTFDDMLRSLIEQVYFQKAANTRESLHEIFNACGHGSRQPSKEQLVKCISGMLEHCSTIHIVLDALDECTTRLDVFAWLEEWCARANDRWHIIITSRPEHDINVRMRRLIPEQAIVAIVDGPVQKDITEFIRHELESGQNPLRRWREHPKIREKIERVLVEKAGGMFRWAACQLDALGKCINLRMLDEALCSLPDDLSETYTRILQSVPDHLLPETTRILQLLVFSDRPLTCKEVIDALAVSVDGEPTFHPEDATARSR